MARLAPPAGFGTSHLPAAPGPGLEDRPQDCRAEEPAHLRRGPVAGDAAVGAQEEGVRLEDLESQGVGPVVRLEGAGHLEGTLPFKPGRDLAADLSCHGLDELGKVEGELAEAPDLHTELGDLAKTVERLDLPPQSDRQRGRPGLL